MKIQFCGAAGTTTGSQHLIEVNGQRILLDCGLYQGRRNEALERNRHFPFDAAKIDCVVLSHCHIDHSGNLPNLVKQGFNGNIYATPATRDLCSIMLPDSAKIQEGDVEWLNKKRKKTGEPLLEPTYTNADAERTIGLFVTVGYHRPMHIADGVKLTFIDAGHVLGSAQVVLDINDHDTGNQRRLLFSGDVGRPNNDLLNDAEPCDGVDFLVMESTYGGRHHELAAHTSDRICEIINDALERRGKVIIPAFAVERTQQLLLTLDRLRHEGCLPFVATFVDSPLAVDATNIFRLHLDAMKPTVGQAIYTKDDPFGFDGLELVRDRRDSQELNHLKGPAIIISASGMAENGRILHHLRNNIQNPNNTILFVGYCAENTLGWKLRNGFEKVNILGDEFAVRAKIEILDSFSGHADHNEMLGWFSRVGGAKERVFLVHGERERSQILCDAVQQAHPAGKVEVARLLQQETL
ncbi:MAG: MBL fold metallo-hydrolase [Verrucomicrobiaceae bacterium]|nr:MBL fold metallo-hydrolase [Verrucomicrobiaceae bacterium]